MSIVTEALQNARDTVEISAKYWESKLKDYQEEIDKAQVKLNKCLIDIAKLDAAIKESNES
jgi:hypothetical protein